MTSSPRIGVSLRFTYSGSGASWHESTVRVPRLDVPVVDGGAGRTAVALLIARVHADAPGLVVVGVAENARHFRSDVVADAIRRVVDGLDADVEHHAVVVERTRGLDVDRRADTAGRDVSTAGLVDLDRADRFGSEIREVEGTRVAGRCRR